ncbi:MAG: hypothetical protein WCT22_00510 [Patescibacteria group bacterium]
MSITLEHFKNPATESLTSKELQLVFSLRNYLGHFYGRLPLSPQLRRERGAIREKVFMNALQIIARNNEQAAQYSHKDFDDIITREKDIRGPCSLGISICIDGRLIIPFIAGRLIKAHEAKAGLIEIENSPIDGKNEIKSGRLTEAIKKKAEQGDLLEILFAHMSVHDKKHGCGAMLGLKKKYNIPDNVDLVKNNLKIHEKSALLIKKLFNKVREQSNKPKLKRVAITAVYDTDHMGVILGYDKKIKYSTTELTKKIAPKLYKLLTSKGNDVLTPGILKKVYTDPKHAYNLEALIAETIPTLLELREFSEVTDKYFDNYYNDLNKNQLQALKYFLARTVVFQYLSGAYEQIDHPNAYHAEDFQSITQDGPNIGQFMVDSQVFGAGPLSHEDAVGHIIDQTKLMQTYSKSTPPYVLFIVKSVSENIQQESMERIRGINREYYMDIISDPRIQALMRDGLLAPIPAIINDKTREVIEIPDFAI